MRNQFDISKRAIAILSFAMLGFAIGGWASPQSHEPASDSSPAANAKATRTGKMPPLEIAREGYVFAGGKYSTEKDAKIMSGQIYAEFQIPAHQRHPYPIVFIHGGAQTGTNFTGTPDGREGWATTGDIFALTVDANNRDQGLWQNACASVRIESYEYDSRLRQTIAIVATGDRQ